MKFLRRLLKPRPRRKRIDIARRFDLIGRVGQGSMSKVWRARDLMTGRVVALKILDKEKTKKLDARFPGLQRPSEGEVAVQLQHPHIVRTYEYGYTRADEQFLVMEFVEGLGLSYLVDVQNETMKRNRLRFAIELGEAISYFHHANWIHRDLCPRNVIVDRDNSIKLIDFGLVVPNTPDFQKPGNRTGTANYMAPELIRRQRTDQRIDIFSFAVTCYEIYARHLPWEAAQSIDAAMAHLNKPPTDIREHVPDLDESVAKTIMKGLAISPDSRWQTIDDMLGPLRQAQRRLDPESAAAS